MDPIAPLITAFHNEGRPRVWSLLVTVFGDAVQHRGGRIATLRLQHLLERVGVEAGALRTALSRLSRDGWVLRDREGRNSFYRLSEAAKVEIDTASVDIYAAPLLGEINQWVMASGDITPAKSIPVASNLWLIPAALATDMPDHICLRGALTSFPKTVNVISPEHQTALDALLADITALNGVTLNPLDAMAARMLLIHRWRRIVLRYPDVPPELFPANAPLKNPRKILARAYDKLRYPSEIWLDSDTHGTAPMPASAASFASRFT